MTAIVGIVTADGDIYMGSDSAGTTPSGSQSVYKTKKIFSPVKGPAYIIGTCGDYRLAQVMRYSFVPPHPPGPQTDIEEFMAVSFVNSVRACYKAAGILTNEPDGLETGSSGSFLVGYQGRLFEMQENFQIITDQRNYMAIGSGETLCLGALFATEGVVMDPVTRITLAVKAAVAFNSMCREPLDIQKMAFDPNWHQPIKVKKPRKKPSGKGK